MHVDGILVQRSDMRISSQIAPIQIPDSRIHATKILRGSFNRKQTEARTICVGSGGSTKCWVISMDADIFLRTSSIGIGQRKATC